MTRVRTDRLRNLETVEASRQEQEFHGEEGLSLKIALGSYRMFFIPETEDYFYRTRTPAEVAKLRKHEEALEAEAKARFEQTYAAPPSASVGGEETRS